MSQIINYQGQRYEITNWDEFKEKLLTGVGLMVEREVVSEVNKMRLVDTGKFKGSIVSEVQDGELVISSTAPYAVYLEYGTYDYWQRFGIGSFPDSPDPKKKDMKASERKSYPKGMQPFAPFRRVLYNKGKMENIITRGVKLASK
jgi:hypothetical protein